MHKDYIDNNNFNHNIDKVMFTHFSHNVTKYRMSCRQLKYLTKISLKFKLA